MSAKPDLVRSPDGPNTIVDFNVKIKNLVLPTAAGPGSVAEMQEVTGRCFVSTDPADTHFYILYGSGDTAVFKRVANTEDLGTIDNTLTYLASNTKEIGNADPNHTDIGEGGTIVFDIGTVLRNTKYMPILTINSNSTVSPQNDLFHNLTILEKTTSTFSVYFRETANLVQDISVDWVIIPLPGYYD